MERRIIISNTCVGSEIYLRAKKKYVTPLVGSIFLDDHMYLKFIENYTHYIQIKPEFQMISQDKHLPGLKNIYPNYPLLKLNDIEIHFIHEGDIETVRNKWERRLERGNDIEPIFTWSASEFMEPREGEVRQELIDRFCSVPHFSIFLTERQHEEKSGDNFVIKFIPAFSDKKQDDRFPYKFTCWNNQYAIAMHIESIMKEKKLRL